MFQFPTTDEWKAIQGTYPFESLDIQDNDFDYSVHGLGTMEAWRDSIAAPFWKSHLTNRLIQARWSWVMFMFFFNKGIPDEEWHISPGSKGQSVEYFPHFEEEHHLMKAQFNYYEDVFYSRFYSGWDTLGHILNIIYDLGIARPDFHRSVEALQAVRPDLYTDLKAIVGDADFIEMKRLRHDSTHNELPSGVSKTVEKHSSGFSFGVGEYTTSGFIADNAPKAMNLFAKALAQIRAQIARDT